MEQGSALDDRVVKIKERGRGGILMNQWFRLGVTRSKITRRSLQRPGRDRWMVLLDRNRGPGAAGQLLDVADVRWGRPL
jgi:hypothetical protein